ncbi:class I SAM-dependent methyltransferase [Nonomuraea recticatena]|uniref:Methyltransferase type 11 domain-containing protein n=1 Tax=Nonomuraea recticatena TaxID=46178 RepID=A0ABN3RIK4_9ACTN
MSTPRDYDTDPGRFRVGAGLTARHLTGGTSLYALLAERLRHVPRVLDIGCADGALRAELPQVVGVDAALTLLREHPAPRLMGEATALPFADGSFGAAVAVNMLYHLPDPLEALREARRVLAPGGMFVAATPSRADSPELAEVWRPSRTTFDAEEAPELVAAVFERVEVERWDAPLITLPDAAAVRDYLVTRFVPRERAESASRQVSTPITLTKRGAMVWGFRGL